MLDLIEKAEKLKDRIVQKKGVYQRILQEKQEVDNDLIKNLDMEVLLQQAIKVIDTISKDEYKNIITRIEDLITY